MFSPIRIKFELSKTQTKETQSSHLHIHAQREVKLMKNGCNVADAEVICTNSNVCEMQDIPITILTAWRRLEAESKKCLFVVLFIEKKSGEKAKAHS